MNIKEKLAIFISPTVYGHIMDVARIANDKGQKVALVGGVVRDALLGREVLDADVMLESPVKPIVEEWVKGHAAQVVSHDRFLTFSVYFGDGQKFDVVTAREESYPNPAQLPVVKPSTILKDLRRRDFTINAMVCWLTKEEEGELLDPFFGRDDIKNKKIRALHSASFLDDPTRIFRAARFAGRLGFEVEPDTRKWILESLSQKKPDLLSPVRRRHEFELILKEDNPSPAISLLEEWGALPFIHREWNQSVTPLLPVLSKKGASKLSCSLLVWRLAIWFRPWGADRALQMMTDLNFEKDIKKQVVELI